MSSSGQSSLKNSKIESKKDVIFIDNSMLKISMKKVSPMIDIKSRLKVTQVQQRRTFITLSNLKYAKKTNIIIVYAGPNDIISNIKSSENYKIIKR